VQQGASLTHTIYGFYQRPCPISPEGVALLDNMLAIDPARRLTLDAVLQSPWMTNQKLPQRKAGGIPGANGTIPYSDDAPRYRAALAGPDLVGASQLSSAHTMSLEYVVDDDQPVYRSFGMGGAAAPRPPGLARQRAFEDYEEDAGGPAA